MNVDEEQLGTALRELAGREPSPAAPTAHLISRGQRAKRTRAATRTTAALGVVGLVAAAAVGFGGIGPGGGGGGNSGTTPRAGGTASAEASSPQFRLAAAAEASAQTSFSFQVTVHNESEDGAKRSSSTRSYEGAFDPNGPKGYLRFRNPPATGLEQRLVGTDLYIHRLSKWMKFENRSLEIDGGYLLSTNPTSTVNPASQLDALKSLGTVTALGASGSGAEAVERYAFSYDVKPSDADEPDRIPASGVIEINAQSRLISKISYQTTYDFSRHVTQHYVDKYTVTWVYSNYGAPVDVPVPPVIN
ncbi:hypothetical protein AB0J86_32595 [Micromonospora sp. NPDC049559]|uniref:hypothetical protein n=1 Tax=Micromonospora sp. NPDC049559 TaxID=3155923 RepID=UPI0034138037